MINESTNPNNVSHHAAQCNTLQQQISEQRLIQIKILNERQKRHEEQISDLQEIVVQNQKFISEMMNMIARNAEDGLRTMQNLTAVVTWLNSQQDAQIKFQTQN